MKLFILECFIKRSGQSVASTNPARINVCQDTVELSCSSEEAALDVQLLFYTGSHQWQLVNSHEITESQLKLSCTCQLHFMRPYVKPKLSLYSAVCASFSDPLGCQEHSVHRMTTWKNRNRTSVEHSNVTVEEVSGVPHSDCSSPIENMCSPDGWIDEKNVTHINLAVELKLKDFQEESVSGKRRKITRQNFPRKPSLLAYQK